MLLTNKDKTPKFYYYYYSVLGKKNNKSTKIWHNIYQLLMLLKLYICNLVELCLKGPKYMQQSRPCEISLEFAQDRIRPVKSQQSNEAWQSSKYNPRY